MNSMLCVHKLRETFDGVWVKEHDEWHHHGSITIRHVSVKARGKLQELENIARDITSYLAKNCIPLRA